MVSIAQVLRQIKEDVPGTLSGSSIERACRQVGHRWRDRKLGPIRTVHLFMLQILHGNIACSALRHVAWQAVSASAYCQARARLPLKVFKVLASRMLSKLVEHVEDEGRWHGHRIIHIDGSSFSMPDTEELQAHFGQPGGQRKGCGFPVAHLCAIMHAGSGMILDLMASPLRTHDMADAVKHHEKMKPGDVLVGDRGFCSYAHLALISLGAMYAVFRAHQRQIICFGKRRHGAAKQKRRGEPTSIFVRSLGHQDQVVRWVKSPHRPKWMSGEQFASLPDSLLLRELAYPVRRKGFRTRHITLVTTLVDADCYSKQELARLYFERWEIETNFRHLKQTMEMDVLRCQTVDGVMKELWMFAMVYNLVRAAMMKAAHRQGVPPNRISFVDALRFLRHVKLGQCLCDLIVNPHREGRIEPRVVKRRPKQYKHMQQPRDKLRKHLENKHVAA